MGKYDGTVRIDTRMDTGGFNKGIAKIGGAMRNVFIKLAIAGTVVAIGFIAILAVLVNIVRWLAQLGKVMFDVGKDTYKYAKQIEELKTTFASLKMALADAFRPLIMFALPWIQQVVSWAQALLSLIAQIMAGLTGQSGYWKTTATAAGSAADATKEVAENTKKAGEAAEGALASFDDLNVLQMAKEEDTSPTGGGGGAAGTSQEWVPIGEKAIGIIDKIKTKLEEIKEFFAPLEAPLDRIEVALGRIWKAINKAANAIWVDLGPSFIWFRDEALLPTLNIMAYLLEDIADWAEENPEAMKGVVAAFMLLGLAVLLVISPVAQIIAILIVLIILIPQIKIAWETTFYALIVLVNWFASHFQTFANTIGSIINNILIAIKGVWAGAKLVFQGIMLYLEGAFTLDFRKMWDGVKMIFSGVWMIIVSMVRGYVNSIIDIVNGMIRTIINGVNSVINALNLIPGVDLGNISVPQIKHLPTSTSPVQGGSAMSIPRFATGAVIPPNAAFLAMLGDQRHGTNIEAPEELIRQIVREEGGGGKEVTINFAGSLGALVRELKPYIDKENNRIGRSLVKGSIS